MRAVTQRDIGLLCLTKKREDAMLNVGPRVCGVAHMALPFFPFFLQRPPLFGIILADWLHLQLANTMWPCNVLQIQATRVQMRRALVLPGEEIRPGIQHEPRT